MHTTPMLICIDSLSSLLPSSFPSLPPLLSLSLSLSFPPLSTLSLLSLPPLSFLPLSTSLSQVDSELEIKAYYAGHVLGAAMFLIRVGDQSVVYTVSCYGYMHMCSG